MAEPRQNPRPDRPLLSITIPTYNRSPFLAQLLECLLSELKTPRPGEPYAELIISDNASSDNTQSMLEGFRQRGLPFRYVRNATNLGADANFLQCLEMASGKYAWILGDDDLLAPNAIAGLLAMLHAAESDFDLVYLSSAGFAGADKPVPVHDKLGRFAELVTDGDYFLEKVNGLIGLISVNIVNKDRLLATPHPEISELNGTSLLQVGWLFPVLHRRCRVLYVWERLLYYRHFNSGGWGICEVFGLRLGRIAQRYFTKEPSLANALMQGVLRYWLPDAIIEMRRGRQRTMHTEDFLDTLRPAFAGQWRFWLFVYPVAATPMVLAVPIHKLLRSFNKASRAIQALVRFTLRRGSLIEP